MPELWELRTREEFNAAVREEVLKILEEQKPPKQLFPEDIPNFPGHAIRKGC